MKVALVHDYLREYGGAERVVEAMHEMWPEAPLYTSFVDWEALGTQSYRFRDWDIRTSWVQDNPLVKRLHSPLRFLAPKIWESFSTKGGLSGYDVVISSSGWFISRGVKAGGDALKRPLHICYIHHPPRNLYGYATGSTLQKYWPVRAYATVINFFMRHYDYETAQRVDWFIANSQETARRVKKFYRRESTVIYPPVEISNIKYQIANKYSKNQIWKSAKRYFLSVGRLTYSKRVDLAIEACNRLQLPLKVVGTGKEGEYLRSIAGPNVEFLGSVSDEELAKLYAGAKALIFCALDEDFGMVPVEAMAAGTPVVTLAQGGVLETVVDGNTGLLFHKPTVEDLATAMKHFNDIYNHSEWANACRAQARKFTKERFQKELKGFVEEKFRSQRC